jgi:hypothetical protein
MPKCILTLLVIMWLPWTINCQIDVPVVKIELKTADGVSITTSLTSKEIIRGNDIVVHYVVLNNSSKTVQFVKQTKPLNIGVFDLWRINVQSPFIYADAHRSVDYEFIKLQPGRAYKSTLVIPATIYLNDKNYAFENAAIQTNFLYLLGNSPPFECHDIEYSLPCLSAVSKVGKEVTVGMLVLNIRSK